MRRTLTILSMLPMLAAAIGAACAADLPSRKDAPVFDPAPAFSWTGLYVGVQGGGAFGREQGVWADAARVLGMSPYGAYPDGGLIGGHIGYNQQFDRFVLGLEADANAALGVRAKTSTVFNSAGLFGNPVGTTPYGIGASQSNNEDIRLRLGYALDRTLLYVAGGAAFGDMTTRYSSAAAGTYLSVTSGRVGWTVGGGLEHALTDALLVRIEYRHTDLGVKSFSDPTGGPAGDSDRIGFRSDAVLAGLSWKFGAAPAPVVAKY